MDLRVPAIVLPLLMLLLVHAGLHGVRRESRQGPGGDGRLFDPGTTADRLRVGLQ